MNIHHAYILRTGRLIEPFQRPVGTLCAHNVPLAEWQQQVLGRLGLRVEWIERTEQIERFPCLVVADDLYFTFQAAERFLKQLRGRKTGGHGGGSRPVRANGFRAALPCTELTERILPALQGTRASGPQGQACRAYELYALSCCDPSRPLDQQTRPLPLGARQTRIRTRAARVFEPTGKFSIPVSTVFLTPIRHWAALLSANLLGMPGLMLDRLRRRPFQAMLLPLRAIFRAGSVRPARMAGKLYLAGRGCQVHPTAHVEGALLGQHVRIGPQAVVRGCVVGSGSEIGPGAVVEGCTLGGEVTINGNVVLRCSVVGDRASVGCFFNQFSVIGPDAVLCPDSGILDFHMRREVSVQIDGRSVSSGSRLLGGCVGDGAFLGPGVKLLAGQEVPAGTVLVTSPRHLVRRPQDTLPPGVVRLERQPSAENGSGPADGPPLRRVG